MNKRVWFLCAAFCLFQLSGAKLLDTVANNLNATNVDVDTKLNELEALIDKLESIPDADDKDKVNEKIKKIRKRIEVLRELSRALVNLHKVKHHMVNIQTNVNLALKDLKKGSQYREVKKFQIQLDEVASLIPSEDAIKAVVDNISRLEIIDPIDTKTYAYGKKS
ncbi:MAG TPA: hypothetical protein QGF02_02190 [Candidatus Babeliales bacterium]|nr:hypothetical protein [Candidatus Babeliales bacterium]